MCPRADMPSSIPPRFRRARVRAALALAALLAVSSFAAPAAGGDPLDVLRTFCQADGNGVRLRASTWPAVAPLVAWGLEPAWDQLYLIHG